MRMWKGSRRRARLRPARLRRLSLRAALRVRGGVHARRADGPFARSRRRRPRPRRGARRAGRGGRPLKQVHGRSILHLRRTARESARNILLGEGDAVLTCQPNVLLVVASADCVPIVLADPVTGWIAAVHAGWRGTAARVLDAALDALAARGVRRRTSPPRSAPRSRATGTRSGPRSSRRSATRTAASTFRRRPCAEDARTRPSSTSPRSTPRPSARAASARTRIRRVGPLHGVDARPSVLAPRRGGRRPDPHGDRQPHRLRRSVGRPRRAPRLSRPLS